jgi:hypothetical protein
MNELLFGIWDNQNQSVYFAPDNVWPLFPCILPEKPWKRPPLLGRQKDQFVPIVFCIGNAN